MGSVPGLRWNSFPGFGKKAGADEAERERGGGQPGSSVSTESSDADKGQAVKTTSTRGCFFRKGNVGVGWLTKLQRSAKECKAGAKECIV